MCFNSRLSGAIYVYIYIYVFLSWFSHHASLVRFVIGRRRSRAERRKIDFHSSSLPSAKVRSSKFTVADASACNAANSRASFFIQLAQNQPAQRSRGHGESILKSTIFISAEFLDDIRATGWFLRVHSRSLKHVLQRDRAESYLAIRHAPPIPSIDRARFFFSWAGERLECTWRLEWITRYLNK